MNFESGLENGPWRLYYKTGELWIEANFRKGRTNRPVHFFYPSGRVCFKGECEKGVLKTETIQIFSDVDEVPNEEFLKKTGPLKPVPAANLQT